MIIDLYLCQLWESGTTDTKEDLAMLLAWKHLLCNSIFYSAIIPQSPFVGRDVTMQLVESMMRKAENKPEECASVLLVSRWVLRWVSCRV
jgi:hypothetical protein